MTEIRAAHKPGLNLCAIKKCSVAHGRERYVFLWEDGRHLEAIQHAANFADNPELSFTWDDARAMAQQARRLAKEEHRAQ